MLSFQSPSVNRIALIFTANFYEVSINSVFRSNISPVLRFYCSENKWAEYKTQNLYSMHIAIILFIQVK
jgi:hypothetical protein